MNNLELKDMEWTEDLFEPLDSSEQNSEFIAMEEQDLPPGFLEPLQEE